MRSSSQSHGKRVGLEEEHGNYIISIKKKKKMSGRHALPEIVPDKTGTQPDFPLRMSAGVAANYSLCTCSLPAQKLK